MFEDFAQVGPLVKITFSPMSKRWSCDTLRVGYNHVMSDAVALKEAELEQQIQDCFGYVTRF